MIKIRSPQCRDWCCECIHVRDERTKKAKRCQALESHGGVGYLVCLLKTVAHCWDECFVAFKPFPRATPRLREMVLTPSAISCRWKEQKCRKCLCFLFNVDWSTKKRASQTGVFRQWAWRVGRVWGRGGCRRQIEQPTRLWRSGRTKISMDTFGKLRQMSGSLPQGENIDLSPVDGVKFTVRVDNVVKCFEVEWKDVRCLPSSSDADVSRNATPRAHSESIRSVSGLLKVMLRIVFGDEFSGAAIRSPAASGIQVITPLHAGSRACEIIFLRRMWLPCADAGSFSVRSCQALAACAN